VARTVSVNVDANPRGFISGMRQVQGSARTTATAVEKIADSTDRAERRARSFRTAAGVAFLVAGAAAIKFGGSSVRAYAEAQTAQNRLQDAFAKFPRLADTNIGALRNLNTELARKTRFDDDATASGQAVLAQFKLTGAQITELTPLLQDYAAKTGKDLPTAAKDLGRAMLGQGRALKTIGIDFKDTGTAGGNFAQIMGGLRTQVGGFAEKEGKTAAGQAEILRNQFGELQESVGQALLPALLKVGSGVLSAVNSFNDLDDSTKSALLTIGGGVLTLGLSAVAVGKLVVGVRAARDAFSALSITAKSATIATAGIGAVLGVAALAFGLYASEHAKAKQRVDDFTQALKGETEAVKQNVTAVAAKQLQDAGAFAAAQKLGLGLDLVTRAALGEQDALAQVNAVIDHYTQAGLNSADVDANIRVGAANDLGRAIGNTGSAYNDAVTEARNMQIATGGAATAMKTGKTDAEHLTTATKNLKNANKDLNVELQKSIDKFTILRNGALGVEQANLAWQQSLDDVRKSTRDNGRTLDTHSEKGRNNRTAVINMITALNDKVTADVKEAGAVRKGESAQTAYERAQRVATTSTRTGTTAIRKAAEAAGLNKDEVNAMIKEFLKSPKAAGDMGRSVDNAARDVRGLDKDINNLNSKDITLKAKYQAYAAKKAKEFFSHVPGSQASSFAHLPVLGGPPAGRRNIDSMIGGAPTATPEGDHAAGGPLITGRHSAPGAAQVGRLTRRWDDVNARAASEVYSDGLRGITTSGQRALTAAAAASAAAPGAPGGKISTVPRNRAAVMAAMRARGARSFTTYPGHHPSADRARDVTPHNWAIANAARASSSVWYVIYQMRIASKTKDNTWRPFVTSSRRGDWQHRRHVHVAFYDRGGWLKPGVTLAVNNTKRSEWVQPVHRSGGGLIDYQRPPVIGYAGGGYGGGVVKVENHFHFDNYVGSRSELRDAMVQMVKSNHFKVLTR
jgi:hypothetical protein